MDRTSLAILSSMREYNEAQIDKIVQNISTLINYPIALTEANHAAIKKIRWKCIPERDLITIFNQFEFYIRFAYLRAIDITFYNKFFNIASDIKNPTRDYRCMLQEHFLTKGIPNLSHESNTRIDISIHLHISEQLESRDLIINLCINALSKRINNSIETNIRYINFGWRDIIKSYLTYDGIYNIATYIDGLDTTEHAKILLFRALNTRLVVDVTGLTNFDYTDSYAMAMLKKFYLLYTKYVDYNSFKSVHSRIAFVLATWNGRNIWSELHYVLDYEIEDLREFTNILKCLQQSEISDIDMTPDNDYRIRLQAALETPELVELYDNFVKTIVDLKYRHMQVEAPPIEHDITLETV